MGIGYLLLYGALAVVALWLVAELLFQNRAPLHWRGLALAGFLAVAGGMAIGSVPVIGAGAAMFAVGQTFVTLSVKRGYAAGWSLRAADGSLPGPLAKVPLLGALTGGGAAVAAAAVAVKQVGEVGAVEEAPAVAPAAEETAVEQTAAFEMQELAADGVYASAYYEQQQTELLQAVPQQDAYTEAYQAGYDHPAQQQQQQYGYDQQQWQPAQQQPAFGYDQGYGGYPQQEPYGTYQQQPDPYAGYQQQQQQYGYDQQQQWQPAEQQPDQPITGIPQQPQQPHYDQYGYQQQHPTWQQQP
ncbi:hypothetical protein [Kitasatospora purpeofusca]|uniref:hypothetical protein n=1 Tax=Kitasatospora purpeofusca TaxID=67352 RepID=UPI0036D2EB2D